MPSDCGDNITMVQIRRKSFSLEELSDGQLRCHLHNRHMFNDDPDIYLRKLSKGQQGWQIVFECKSCGVIRIDTCEPETFELWSREYQYHDAQGYKLLFAATVQDFRAETVRRKRMSRVRARRSA